MDTKPTLTTEERTQILEIWQRSGRPAIPLRQGETCRDLEKFLSHSNIRDSDIEAIKTWVKEVKVSNEKGHCEHGEFILLEGCPKCIAERRQAEHIGLEPAPELIGVQLAEEAGIVEAEEEDESHRAPYNASYHAPYYLADGTIVPSVTTVLGILDKPGLPYWAWELGQQGLDYREVRDSAGRVGTIAHHLIACHLKGETPDYFAVPVEVERAQKCFEKYLRWEKEHPISPVMVETPLVSEEFRYGGTFDLLAELDSEFVLIDFKTGGGIYESMFYQLAAYWKLLTEQGWPVSSARILRMNADYDDFEEVIRTSLGREWKIFTHCLAIYRLQGEVG